MRKMLLGAVAALGVSVTGLVTGAGAQTTLAPANPQPSGLKTGLAVTYAFPNDVKMLNHAEAALKAEPKRGKPLKGLSYPEIQGGTALTSGQRTSVAAQITGYMKFDETGVYRMRFFTNDGLRIHVGGARVGYEQERTPCSSTGWVEVNIPRAGWYPLHALWFQRLSNSCLEAEWQTPSGKKGAVPNSAFGYR